MTKSNKNLAARPEVTEPSPFDSPMLMVLLVLIALVGLYNPRTLAPVLDRLSLPDTDDVMRLVQVRDLISGQGWFDLVQHRMLPPDGISSHWSRLIDLPITGFILALRPIFGQSLAEAATAALWPLSLFTAYGVIAFFGMRRMFGWRQALLILFVASQTSLFLNVFQFGRIDHHNAQSCALLALALALADPGRLTRRGVLAGLVGGLSLAIGLETLPVLAAAGLFVLADWVVHGDRASGILAGFGASFFGTSVVLFGVQTAPALWAASACDALSPPWLLLTMGGAVVGGMALVVDRITSSRASRLGIAVLCGATLCGAFVLCAPSCLAGPFAGMDALVRRSWLDQVDEMQSLLQTFQSRPGVALANIVPLIAVALYSIVMAFYEPASDRRRFFRVVAVLMIPGTLIALVQARGMYIAGAFVPLVGAIALDRAILLLQIPASRTLRLVVLVLPLTMLGKVWAFTIDQPMRGLISAEIRPESDTNSNACTDPASLAALNRLPTGLVLSIIDLGPAILLRTHHSIVAAPYHRNLVGLRAAIEATEGTQETLHDVALERGADYLLLCTTALASGGENKPVPFATSLAHGTQPAPNWLEPITVMPVGSPLKVWHIQRP